MADLQDHEQRIGALEAEMKRINERMAAQSRSWQGDVADLKSDIAMLRAEVVSNHAEATSNHGAVIKQLGEMRTELDALPRVIADMLGDLKNELPAIIGAELDKRSA